jgi:hypothetical protein
MSDNPDACEAFWSGESTNGRPYAGLTPHYHQVTLTSHTPVPTALIHHVCRLLQHGKPVEAAAAAFWACESEWECLEYMTDQFVVASVHPAPNNRYGSAYIYNLGVEIARAKRKWPC